MGGIRSPRDRRWSGSSTALGVALLLLSWSCGDGGSSGTATVAGAAEAGPEPAGGPSGETRVVLEPGAVESVLLITVDTLRADALGFAGNAEAATPVLDRLAAAGRVYPDAHAHNVVTLPSHANILTGRLPFEHGVRDNSGFVLPDSLPTAATLLAREGLATAAVVGAFPLDSRYGLDRGFGLYDDEYPVGSRPTEFVPAERRGDEVVARALGWWRKHQGERRFLWVHLFDPHAPYEPPEPFAARFSGDPYAGEVAATDAFLAPLLEPFLEGREPPTLIVFTADHGEALGDHGELTHGLFAYEATLRVPLVLWAPGIRSGVSPLQARHVDLLPTMLEAVGVAAPPGLPGRSLLRETPGEEPGRTYFESLSPALNRGWAPLRGVLQGPHKLISLPLPELYDLEADPREARNLVEERADLARRLRAALPEESSWPPPRRSVSEEERVRLESLGYVSGGAASRERYTAADDPKRLVALDRKVHRVVDLYQRGRLEEALGLAREVVAERPGMPVGYTYLAQVLLERGELGEAVGVMTEARRREAASPMLLRQLGLSLAQAGRFDEALAVLRPLVDREASVEAVNALGLALSEAGRQEEAGRVLRQALEQHPGNPLTRQHLALVALRRGDWAAARDEARRALELNGDLTLAWSYLGTAATQLGDPRAGLEAWERAVALDPANYDALYNIALVAARIGDEARARGALERFLATAPASRYGPDLANARAMLERLGG